MNNYEYWSKRAEDEKNATMQGAETYNDKLHLMYKQAIQQIQKDVATWYKKYAKENGVSLADAKQALSPKERQQLIIGLKEYIALAKKERPSNAEKELLTKSSIAVRLTRLEAIYLEVVKYIDTLAMNTNDSLQEILEKAYQDTYYKTAYMVQSMKGKYKPFPALDKQAINEAVSNPWAPDGKNFSERIWDDRAKLAEQLPIDITRSLLIHEGADKLSKRLSKRYETSYNNARRLVETETAFIHERASKNSMDELGVEKVKLLAVLDSHTSEICRELDGKIVPLKGAKIGVDLPPFHCWCRTTTVPYIEGVDDVPTQRTARDPTTGKSVKVDGQLNYNEWKTKYIDK